MSYGHPSQPYTKAFLITPNNSADLATPTRGIVVAVGGTVTVDMAEQGTNITITLPAGIHPLRVTRVYSTGTAATGLVGLV